MPCTVIHIKDAPKGWENNSDYVYIGRKSKKFPNARFGNPWPITDKLSRQESIDAYKGLFETIISVAFNMDETAKLRQELLSFKEDILKLKNKTLVCYCKPLDCHGDIIADWLNKK